MTLSKEEAKKKIEQLEKEVANLQKIVDGHTRNSNISIQDDAWELSSDDCFCGQLIPGDKIQYGSFLDVTKPLAIFESREQAAAYGDAIVTLCQLRRMPNTLSHMPSAEGRVYTIVVEFDYQKYDYDVRIEWWTKWDLIMSMISPAFLTKEDAEYAIGVIGSDRLVHMFKTFHHVNCSR